MLQANPTPTSFGSFTAPGTYGRPKRGTPDYAAAVRRQIARLAAQHAATIAEIPSAPPEVARTVLLVTSCPKVRTAVREGLRDVLSVHLLEAATLEECRAQLSGGAPHLVLADHAQRGLLAGLMQEAPQQRVVLIADSVPRSNELPQELAGVLARPLKADRVQRQVLSLLGQPG